MKTAFLRGIGLILLITSLSSCMDFIEKGEEGSGKVIRESREVSDFKKITVSEGINAYITMGDEESLEIEADDNLVPLIVTEVKNNKLTVKIKDGFGVKSSKALNVFIKAKALEGLKASSSANIKMETDLAAERLSCDASSAADIDLRAIEVQSFDAEASSSGEVQVEKITAASATMDASSAGDIKCNGGNIDKVNLQASSSGGINAKNITSKNCTASASSGASISIQVSEELSANASSGGQVTYKGNPRVKDMNTSSGGKVTSDN